MRDDYEYIIGGDLENLIKNTEISLTDIVLEMGQVYKKLYNITSYSSEYTNKVVKFTTEIIESYAENCYDDGIEEVVRNIYKRAAEMCNGILDDINMETKLLDVEMSPDNMDLIGTLKEYNHEKIILHFKNTI